MLALLENYRAAFRVAPKITILFTPLVLLVSLVKALSATIFVAVIAFGSTMVAWVIVPNTPLGLSTQTILLYLSIGIVSVVFLGVFLREVLFFQFPWIDLDTHGSARFATAAEIKPLFTAAGPIIGRDFESRKLLHDPGNGHLLTMAPTRTGKGVGTVIPNLLKRDGPVICIDPKGENVLATIKVRSRIGPVHVLDPFGITGHPAAAFNPLADLDPHHPDLAEEVAELADALVNDPPGQSGEAHWNEEAKALIGGILLYVVCAESIEHRTLASLRHYLTGAPQQFATLLQAMQECDAAGGLVQRAANRHLGKSDREAAGVLSSAQRHTHFLDSPRMTTTMARSDFSFEDLKHQKGTIFLVLPPDRLATYSRWLRLMIVQSLQHLARDTRPALPILYVLDEFAALGYLAPIERAMGLMAGYGVQLWPILQDIHQLRAIYGKRADTFLANAGVIQVFGVNDHETARLISDLLGQETVVYETTGTSTSRPSPWGDGNTSTSSSTSESRTGRALLTPDEVRRMNRDGQLLFLAGQRPIFAAKIRYYAERDFAGL